jgi:hypothetical protein
MLCFSGIISGVWVCPASGAQTIQKSNFDCKGKQPSKATEARPKASEKFARETFWERAIQNRNSLLERSFLAP